MHAIKCPKCERVITNAIDIVKIKPRNGSYEVDVLTCGLCQSALGTIDSSTANIVIDIDNKLNE